MALWHGEERNVYCKAIPVVLAVLLLITVVSCSKREVPSSDGPASSDAELRPFTEKEKQDLLDVASKRFLSTEESTRIDKLRAENLLDGEFHSKLVKAQLEFLRRKATEDPGMSLPSQEVLRTVRVTRQELAVEKTQIDMVLVQGFGSTLDLYPRTNADGLSFGSSRLPADGVSIVLSVDVRSAEGRFLETKIPFRTREITCSFSNDARVARFAPSGETNTEQINFYIVSMKNVKGRTQIDVEGTGLRPKPIVSLPPKFGNSMGGGWAAPGWPVGLAAPYPMGGSTHSDLLIVDWVKGEVLKSLPIRDIKERLSMYYAFDGRNAVAVVVSSDFNWLAAFDLLSYLEKHHPAMLEALRQGKSKQTTEP